MAPARAASRRVNLSLLPSLPPPFPFSLFDNSYILHRHPPPPHPPFPPHPIHYSTPLPRYATPGRAHHPTSRHPNPSSPTHQPQPPIFTACSTPFMHCLLVNPTYSLLARQPHLCTACSSTPLIYSACSSTPLMHCLLVNPTYSLLARQPLLDVRRTHENLPHARAHHGRHRLAPQVGIAPPGNVSCMGRVPHIQAPQLTHASPGSAGGCCPAWICSVDPLVRSHPGTSTPLCAHAGGEGVCCPAWMRSNRRIQARQPLLLPHTHTPLAPPAPLSLASLSLPPGAQQHAQGRHSAARAHARRQEEGQEVGCRRVAGHRRGLRGHGAGTGQGAGMGHGAGTRIEGPGTGHEAGTMQGRCRDGAETMQGRGPLETARWVEPMQG